MSLLSLIFALLLEQLRPLSSRKIIYDWLKAYVDYFHRNFDGGDLRHGKIAWIIALLLPFAATVGLYWVLAAEHPVFAFAFCVLTLYLTMGFRQFSHFFTDIHKALQENDLNRARQLLTEWRKESCNELSREEVVRLALEEALLATHRKVFGVVVWFVIFMFLGLGPSGAILYRMSVFLKARWRELDQSEQGQFSRFALQIYRWVEWLPVRMTAFSFAIAGNFEDAIYCWRTQSQYWPDPVAGIVLASGAGAMGVRLGGPVEHLDLVTDRPEMGVCDEADVDFMQTAVGLVWRALIFWLIILLLLTLASMTRWVGV